MPKFEEDKMVLLPHVDVVVSNMTRKGQDIYGLRRTI